MGPITVASVADRDDNLARLAELLDEKQRPAGRMVVENRAERRARQRRERSSRR